MISIIFPVLFFIANVNAKIYFKEEFKDDNWNEIWISSSFPGIEWGQFVHSAGKFYGDPEISKGIQTSEDARFYGLSTKFKPFSNKNKVLVLQYSVKHEQKLDCGGGYIKLFDCSLDPSKLQGATSYLIMFGPDICGVENRKVHLIFNYKGQNLPAKRIINSKDDDFTHLYTLVLKPDNTYVVKIDNQVVQEGELENNWDFLLPKTIKDPKVEKPIDWVDESEVEDPNDQKPEDWDQPEFILDKDAAQPVDWDNDMDGDWKQLEIKNPDYKGEWKPMLIPNPQYTGPWIHLEITNPDYKPDPDLYTYDEICGIGFDLWQVKSGSIFDNILITDDEHEAFVHGEATWGAIKEKEKELKEKLIKKKEASKVSTEDGASLSEDDEYESNNDEYDDGELNLKEHGFEDIDEYVDDHIDTPSLHDEL